MLYSTPKDVHIAVQSKLYQINSKRKRTLRDEEIDAAVNKAMIAFIEERSIINTNDVGLDETVKRQDDLRDLKVSRKLVDVITNINSLTNPYQLEKKVLTVLPNDYYKFESLELAINKDCLREESAITFKPLAYKIYKLTFNTPDAASKYDTLTLTSDTMTYSTVNANIQGLHNVASKFMIINSILNTFKSKVYWESYLDYYEADSFILPVLLANPPPELTIDGVTTVGTEILANYTQFSEDEVTDYVPTELTLSKSIADMRRNVYAYRNRKNKPLIELENNSLRIDYNPKYIPLKGFLTYIKKPRFINLNGNVMTDFKSHLEEIIDMAVLILQMTFEGREGLVTQVNKNKE